MVEEFIIIDESPMLLGSISPQNVNAMQKTGMTASFFFVLFAIRVIDHRY